MSSLFHFVKFSIVLFKDMVSGTRSSSFFQTTSWSQLPQPNSAGTGEFFNSGMVRGSKSYFHLNCSIKEHSIKLHACICDFLCNKGQIIAFKLLFLLSKMSIIIIAILRDCHEGKERSESALQIVMCYTLIITSTEAL